MSTYALEQLVRDRLDGARAAAASHALARQYGARRRLRVRVGELLIRLGQRIAAGVVGPVAQDATHG